MRCFSCGKTFEYEKYYGICPKCGCYNKRESAEAQHQEMHHVYDNGYSHAQKTVRKRWSRSSKLLLCSLLVFLVVVFGGTPLCMLYEEYVIDKVQKELIHTPVTVVQHEAGETFSFQDIELNIVETAVIGRQQGFPVPEGKVLISIHIVSAGSGELDSNNQVSDAYLCAEGQCFWQLPSYEYAYFEEVMGYPAYDPYVHNYDTQADGWLAFLIDEDASQFTLCLEERRDGARLFIEQIHQIPMEVKKGASE